MQVKKALMQTFGAIKMSFPTLIGILLLTSFIITVIPKDLYVRVFTNNHFIDAFFGAVIGSVSAGSPITSYVIAGELSARGVGMVVIVAFLVTWVTVGIVQLPAEIVMLGKRFAIVRTIVGFVSAIIIAFLTVITLTLI